MLLWKRGFSFVSTGNEKQWIHSKIRKIRFNQESPPEKYLIGGMAQMSEFYIQNISKTVGWDDQALQDTPVRT